MSVIGYLRDSTIVDVTEESPLPVIARDTRLVIANNDTPFVPTLNANNSINNTDLFGVADGNIANLGIYSEQAPPDVIVADAWRIRRFVILFERTASGGTSVDIAVTVFGRLVRPDGSVTPWRTVGSASDNGSSVGSARLVVATTLSGVFGWDQYRITFRRNPNSDPAPELSNIRVYAEF